MRPDATGLFKSTGFVRFTYRNDPWNVIDDYSMSLEAALSDAKARAAELETTHG